jgi:hypothetical protein
MTDKRAPREAAESREAESRFGSWKPPSMLPSPDPQDGYVFRWIRTSSLGDLDNPNVSNKFRQGWVPVLAKDHKEITIMSDMNSQFPDGIEIGGLVLCKIPQEVVAQRNAYYARMAAQQMESVDNNFMRESHSAMPLFSDKKSKTTFGSSGE